jgi:hypothetical protein
VRWSGTILPGSDPTSDCSTAGGATSDAHTVTIRVPKGAYAANTTTGSFAISWKPASGVEDVNDECPASSFLHRSAAE